MDVYAALPVPIQVVVAVVALGAVGVSVLLAMHWFAGITHRPRRPAAGSSVEASRLRGRMRRLARPTVLFLASTEAGASKLGGDPDLPSGMAWPQVRGRPCAFVAQVDLSAVQQVVSLDWLPAAGLLQAFVDLEGYGFADQTQIRFHPETPGDERLPPIRGLRFPERRVTFAPYASLPSLEWLGIDVGEIDASERELDELGELPDEPFGDEIQHRIGGYPSEIQDEQMGVTCELIRRGLPPAHDGTEITPAILRASRAWQLLLQIDSDPALKMNWGDGGRLYVFVRDQDAKAGDFSRAITLSQTY